MKTGLLLCLTAISLLGQSELRFALRSDPATLNPMLVQDDSSELIRYLTGGVLVRVNRVTQELQGELATGWSQSPDGRALTLRLRRDVKFSGGAVFDSADVVHTFRVLTDPANRNATADAFRSGDQPPTVRAKGPHEVVITFATPLASAARLLDQVAIVSSRSPEAGEVLGPYRVAEQKRGSHLLLTRNPNYWKKDSTGRRLPYIDRLRIVIQPNRELEALAFRRGELDLISGLDSRSYEDLEREFPDQVHDLGPATDSEFLWFNQVPSAAIPDYKKAWFRNVGFRRAISAAVNRADLCRIAYKNHAIPSVGPVPPSNKVWFNSDLRPHTEGVDEVRRMFVEAGFREQGGVLRDGSGNAVAFTVMTNAGNRAREQLAALIQGDLKRFGVQITIVTLDFPALIERMTKTFTYEGCLMGLVNVDLDPNGMMNVWLSSGANHQWNPRQTSPATEWEAEMDRLMRSQSAGVSEAKRRTDYRRVQAIIREQEPFIYLVHPNGLAAWNPRLKNVKPTPLRPNLIWAVEYLYLEGTPGQK